MRKEDMIVLENKEIARDIFEMKLGGLLVQDITEPGQFLHIHTSPQAFPLLRRPLSICKTNKAEEYLTVIYRAEGEGTRLLSACSKGSTLDVIGPLGHGFPVSDVSPGEKVLLAGGGVGVPPLYDTGHTLKEKGVDVTTVLGFSDKGTVFYEDPFRDIGRVFVSTADGSYGTAGFVTDVMEKEKLAFDRIFACGPVPMLKALETKYPEAEGCISLEERMGCGIGVCLACVCHTRQDPDGSDYRKVCSDGPVFPWKEVVL
ncbi:dihydroorotate dehydrogenase electron transfer subunit [Salibacterium aidingense]|uniref:dihydroorotate dehydrogenase electron transfer subunit n=1 Tax=Salibacterium aidingense TaxID=384933 RepID=UPI003BC6468F